MWVETLILACCPLSGVPNLIEPASIFGSLGNGNGLHPSMTARGCGQSQNGCHRSRANHRPRGASTVRRILWRQVGQPNARGTTSAASRRACTRLWGQKEMAPCSATASHPKDPTSSSGFPMGLLQSRPSGSLETVPQPASTDSSASPPGCGLRE